jgi:hypothetical protein
MSQKDEKTGAVHYDEYLYQVKQFKNQRPGYDVISAWRAEPKRSLGRYFVTGHRKIEWILPTDEGAILCPGAPVVVGIDGKARHLRSYNLPGRFGGFVLYPRDDSRAHVAVTGCAVLGVDGSETAQPGAKVFCSDINEFNIKGDGLEIGVLLHKESVGNSRWQVVFAAAGEQLDIERARGVGRSPVNAW